MSSRNESLMSKSSKNQDRLLAANRKARHDYNILETVEAGMMLSGTEVKSARAGRVQLRDGFVEFRFDAPFLVGVHIQPYEHGNRENHLPDRPRKLLMHRRESDRLFGRMQAKGTTAVPLRMYLKGPWIKVEIGLVQGKKLYDKRETERRREQEREAREAVKAARGRRI